MNEFIINGIYEHYKGNRYQLIALANHSETLEPMIVYKAMYGDERVWVRPAGMWNETVTVNGVEVPRFKLVSDK